MAAALATLEEAAAMFGTSIKVMDRMGKRLGVALERPNGRRGRGSRRKENDGSRHSFAEGEVKMRNAPKPWTRKEEEELRALILSGKSVKAIAMKLGRTPPSIQNKAKKLRLLLKRVVQGARGSQAVTPAEH